MTDKHLIAKIESCRSVEELDGLRDGLRAQSVEPSAEVVQAIARQRAILLKGAR